MLIHDVLQILFHLVNILECPDIVKPVTFRQIQPECPARVNGIGNILQILMKCIPFLLHLQKYLLLRSAVSLGEYVLRHSQHHAAHRDGDQKYA